LPHKCANSSFTAARKAYPYTHSKYVIFHAPLFTDIYLQAYKSMLDTYYVNTNSDILTQRMTKYKHQTEVDVIS